MDFTLSLFLTLRTALYSTLFRLDTYGEIYRYLAERARGRKRHRDTKTESRMRERQREIEIDRETAVIKISEIFKKYKLHRV